MPAPRGLMPLGLCRTVRFSGFRKSLWYGTVVRLFFPIVVRLFIPPYFCQIIIVRNLLFFLSFIIVNIASAQVENTGSINAYDTLAPNKLTIGAYVDVYYGYDFNQPSLSDRPYFVSSARHNEININLAYAEFRFKNNSVRGQFLPGFGTYMNSNYINETGGLKYLLEANVGLKLFKNKEIWVDAGVLPSPYTNESAISKDHYMYTRSFAPEYVPYYLSGVKLSLPLHSKIQSYWYLLNGWQVIRDNNKPLSFGSQIEYRPNKKTLLNWDTYIGNENSELNPEFQNRYFSDIYLIYNPEGKLSLTSCIYGGIQERKDSFGTRSQGEWWQANLMARYSFTKKTSLSARIEYFEDISSVQIKSITGVTGFSSYSAGLCFNVKVQKNALFRLEARTFQSMKNVYMDKRNNPINTSHAVIGNLTIWF